MNIILNIDAGKYFTDADYCLFCPFTGDTITLMLPLPITNLKLICTEYLDRDLTHLIYICGDLAHYFNGLLYFFYDVNGLTELSTS